MTTEDLLIMTLQSNKINMDMFNRLAVGKNRTQMAQLTEKELQNTPQTVINRMLKASQQAAEAWQRQSRIINEYQDKLIDTYNKTQTRYQQATGETQEIKAVSEYMQKTQPAFEQQVKNELGPQIRRAYARGDSKTMDRLQEEGVKRIQAREKEIQQAEEMLKRALKRESRYGYLAERYAERITKARLDFNNFMQEDESAYGKVYRNQFNDQGRVYDSALRQFNRIANDQINDAQTRANTIWLQINERRNQSVQTMLRRSVDEVMRMSKKDLQREVTIMKSAAMKRVKGMVREGLSSQAMESAKQNHTLESTRGKTLNELRRQYIGLQNFLSAKTGTVRGQREVMDRTIETLRRDTGIELSREDYDRFWKAYERLKQLDPAVETRGVKYQLLPEINRLVKKNWSVERIVNDMQNRIQELSGQYVAQHPIPSALDLVTDNSLEQ